jgi:hypothetical protein
MWLNASLQQRLLLLSASLGVGVVIVTIAPDYGYPKVGEYATSV